VRHELQRVPLQALSDDFQVTTHRSRLHVRNPQHTTVAEQVCLGESSQLAPPSAWAIPRDLFCQQPELLEDRPIRLGVVVAAAIPV
jgi:hypothetical protein